MHCVGPRLVVWMYRLAIKNVLMGCKLGCLGGELDRGC